MPAVIPNSLSYLIGGVNAYDIANELFTKSGSFSTLSKMHTHKHIVILRMPDLYSDGKNKSITMR